MYNVHKLHCKQSIQMKILLQKTTKNVLTFGPLPHCTLTCTPTLHSHMHSHIALSHALSHCTLTCTLTLHSHMHSHMHSHIALSPYNLKPSPAPETACIDRPRDDFPRHISLFTNCPSKFQFELYCLGIQAHSQTVLLHEFMRHHKLFQKTVF